MATSDSPLSVPNVTLAVARGAGAAPALTGGTSALSYSIAALSRDAEVTIATDGTYDFGSVGPELVMLMDATLADSSGIIQPIFGPNTTIDQALTHIVVDSAPMPGGKGLAIGSGGKLRASTVPHTRGFESRTYYWPVENRASANAYLLDPATDGDNKDWQIKPIWNMSDFKDGATDTNFFMVTWEQMYSKDMRWLPSAVLSTNSISTIYGPSVTTKSGTNPGSEPLDEPYTTEFLYDQVDINSSGQGMFETLTHSPSIGSHYARQIETGRTMHYSAGATRLINSFVYFGSKRGFGYADGHFAVDGDVYKTAGPGAACRVVITDNPNHDAASKKTILEPISWTANQAKVKLRGGWWSLDNLGGKYFCILGADNRQIGTGVQI